MSNINLEYRIAKTHVGSGLIETPGVVVHGDNPYYSYARHLPDDWDLSEADERTNVTKQLLEKLMHTPEGREMDLSPLKNDQRVWGVAYGQNSLQNVFDLVAGYAEKYPDRKFFGKWGGTRRGNRDKKFIFYVGDEEDACLMIEGLLEVASESEILTFAEHQYGLKSYGAFVDIGERLRSPVRDKAEFEKLLRELEGYPHFPHDLFLTDDSVES